MMTPFFKKSDFVLCDVPVPKGYLQSQTHAGVAIYEGNYYLTTSPYPGPQYSLWVSYYRKLLRIISRGKLCNKPSGERFENPCIYIGEKRGKDVPLHFHLMSHAPLMDTPEPFFSLSSYNSDPDIFIEEGVIYVMNRSVIRTKTFQDEPYEFMTRIYLIKGVDENGHFKLLSNELVREGNDNFVSPSLIKFKERYIVTYMDNHLVRRKILFDGLFVSSANNVEDAIKADNYAKVNVNGGEMVPWHMSLFQHRDKLYTIITCAKKNDTSLKMWQMLGEFDDSLTELNIYQTPLTDYNSYRGAALVNEDGLFVLYSTTVWENIKASKSVDGRDIVLAKCQFADLLEHIKGNNY